MELENTTKRIIVENEIAQVTAQLYRLGLQGRAATRVEDKKMQSQIVAEIEKFEAIRDAYAEELSALTQTQDEVNGESK